MTGTWTTNHWLFAPPAGPNYDANYKTGLDQVDARLSKVIYVGDPGYATFAAAVTAISSTPATLFLPAGTHVGTGVTTPITLEVIALHGAVISGTPTINGPFAGDLSQHFTGQPSGTPKIEAVHPEWFGAVVDGATDDSAALNKAKIFAVGAKVPLIIPVGITKGSIALLSTDDGLTIEGADPYNSILTAKDNATATISMANTCNFVTLKNFCILNGEGNNDTHYGIDSQGNAYTRITGIYCSGYNVNCRITNANEIYIEDSGFDSAVYSGSGIVTGHGLFISHPTAGTGVRVRNSRFYSNEKDGIRALELEDDTFRNINCLSNGQYGFAAINSANLKGPFIYNSFFDGQKDAGIYVEKGDNFSLNSVWVSTSVAGGTGGHGIWFKDVFRASVIGLQAYGNIGHGVYLESGCAMNKFSACNSDSNGAGGTGAGYYFADTNYDNTCGNCSAWNNPTIGFHFLDTTAGKPNIITGGISEGNTGGQYVIQSKDLITGSQNSNGGQTQTFTYYRSNLVDGAASGNFYAVPNTDQTLFVSPFTGSLTSISLALNDTRAAGTLSCRPTVNGTSKDNLKVQIDVTNTQYITLTVLSGSIPVAAGDRIGIYFDTDAGWDTTGGAGTVDATATLTILAQ